MATNHTHYHAQRIAQTERIFLNAELLPHRYVFILTNKCNLRCSFCFQDKSHIEGSLSKEDWLQVISQLPDYAHITLTGGEPFLFKGFEEVFLRATEKHTCNIISNGLLLDRELIDLLLSRKNFKVLSISVDNIGNTVRDVDKEKWVEAEKTFREFIKRRNNLSSDALLDTKTVVLDENAKQLFNIYKYCLETLKADTHSYMLLKGSPIQHADQMYSFNEMYTESKAFKYPNFREIVQQLEYVRQYNLLNNRRSFTHPKFVNLNGEEPLTSFDLKFINQIKHEKRNFKPCKAPWGSVHINVEGNLFPCMAIKMGNVKDETVGQIFHGEIYSKFKEVIKKQGTVPGCNRCGYLLPASGLGQKVD